MPEPVPIPPRVPPPPRDPVEDVLLVQRLQGRTMRQLADDHGLTVTRVRELLALNGVTPDQARTVRQREALRRRLGLTAAIGALLAEHGPLTAVAVAQALGTTARRVEQLARPQDRAALLPSPAERWSDDDLAWWLAVYLHRFRTGQVRGGETRGAYDLWARRDPRIPPGQVLLRRFGSWRRAKAAAQEQQV